LSSHFRANCFLNLNSRLIIILSKSHLSFVLFTVVFGSSYLNCWLNLICIAIFPPSTSRLLKPLRGIKVSLGGSKEYTNHGNKWANIFSPKDSCRSSGMNSIWHHSFHSRLLNNEETRKICGASLLTHDHIFKQETP
jgi:hypothetical protein